MSQLVRAESGHRRARSQSWLPQVTAGFLGVFAIDAYGRNKLYVGGDFTRVGTIKRTNFAEFTDGAAPVSADLSVTLSASPANPAVGQNVVYTAKIANAGPDTAVSVTVTDVLPAGLDFVSAPGCTYTSANRTVTCDLGSVTTAGDSVAITAVPTGTGSISDMASVTAATGDPNGANNSATATVVAGAGGADLGVTAAAPGKVARGKTFSLVLKVTNHGPTASAATVVDTLPAGAARTGTLKTTRGSCSGTTTVTCNLGSMASGAAAKITIPLKAPSVPQTLFNAASVSGSVVDPVASNNSAATAVSVASGSDATPPTVTGDADARLRSRRVRGHGDGHLQ